RSGGLPGLRPARRDRLRRPAVGHPVSDQAGPAGHDDPVRRADHQGADMIPQERRLRTAIPGPRSLALAARRDAGVATGLGAQFPAFVAAAGGGVVVDVDGNSLIDFGSGIAVNTVGASAEHVVRRAADQLAAFTHACFIITPYEPYVAVCEALAELTPG